MPIGINLVDGKTEQVARVVQGALTVTPPSFNLIEFKELGTINTAFNFYQPKGGKQFVVTNIFAYGDKQVAANSNATVIVYEATTDATVTVSKIIMQFEIGQNEFHPFNSLNLLVNTNRFINAKTDDNDVHVNILGFFIDDTGVDV